MVAVMQNVAFVMAQEKACTVILVVVHAEVPVKYPNLVFHAKGLD
jgi:hypothetical protein